VKRVLRNTYALLAMTLLFSAGVAAVTLTLRLPAPGLVLTLAAYFGLLRGAQAATQRLGLAGRLCTDRLHGVFAGAVADPFVGFARWCRYRYPGPGGHWRHFLALSSYVLLTRRDFSFMGGFLFVGMVIALIAGLASVLFEMPALGLAVSAMVALLSAGLILFETSRIVNGGETNYVMATVSLYVSVFNLFSSLLSLFGLGGSND